MNDAQVETPSAEQAPPVSDTGNATPSTQHTPTLATGFDAEMERRKWQSMKDREIAAVHLQYQQQIDALKQSAVGRLQQAGDEYAQDWAASLDVEAKAAAFDQMQMKAQQMSQWNNHVAMVAEDMAEAFGVELDARQFMYENFQPQSEAELRQAMRAHANKLRQQQREADEDKRKAAATRQTDEHIASGEASVFGGPPGAPINEKDSLLKEYRAKLKPLQGNVEAIFRLQDEYRGKGLNI